VLTGRASECQSSKLHAQYLLLGLTDELTGCYEFVHVLEHEFKIPNDFSEFLVAVFKSVGCRFSSLFLIVQTGRMWVDVS
jgi:hypothetical protein